MRSRLNSRPSLHSFTLIELMLAMAITSLLVFFFAKTIEVVTKSIQLSRTAIDATTEARFIFDRMNLDFNSMPKRIDMGYHFSNAPIGTDFLRFVSEVKGNSGERNVSLIGYKLVQDTNGFYKLYRGAHGYHWKDIGFMGLDDQNNSPDLLNLSKDNNLHEEDYELLANGVFQVALSFQMKNTGKISNAPPYFSLGTNGFKQSVQIANISSIIVALAMMDPKSQKIMNENQFNLLVSRFTPPPQGCLPLAHWTTNLEYHFPKTMEGIPQPVAQSVQVYQRFYPIE